MNSPSHLLPSLAASCGVARLLNLAWCIALVASPVAYGSIAGGTATIDGSVAEWDLSTSGPDFFAPMHTAGDLTKSLLSNLYLRYDVTTQTLYGLVYRAAGGVNLSVGDAWFKEYSGAFGSNNKLFDASDASISNPGAPDFAWVYSPTDSSVVLGYEASAIVPPAKYNEFEAHVNVGGDTSSTGKENKSGYIMLDLSNIPPPPTPTDDGTVPEPSSMLVWGILAAASMNTSRRVKDRL